MDRPSKIANPARSQLNNREENKCSPVPVRTRLKICPARRVQPPRPASACSFSILRLNLVLTLLTGFLPISAAASIY